MGNIKYSKKSAISVGQRLPMGFRRSLFHFAFSCAPAEFEKFAFLYANAPNQENLLRRMTASGFSPRTVVDVGAYKQDGEVNVAKCHNHSQMGAARASPGAADLDATLHRELLGAIDGTEVQFHVMASGSSILSEHSGVPRQTETRRLTTLDSLLAGGPNLDFLKIDAQGYELSILNGADRVLSGVQAVLLEVALIEVNERSPILHEVLSCMNDRGFVAFDILEMHRRPLDRALCQIDVLFCRRDAKLRADKRFR